MNPISNTAFFTCGARAADATSRKPVCGDSYAALFLNEHGKGVFDAVKEDRRFCDGIVARHRIIDDLLRQQLATNPDTSVVIIGAGFDSRAYRLAGGNWIEIDEPQVINFKNQYLSADQCQNSLRRISVDFAQAHLSEILPEIAADNPVVVVMEGIFSYLSEAQISETIRSLQQAFPGHTLVCDLISRRFMERHGRNTTQHVEALGAPFKFLVDEPSLIFMQAGYRPGSVFSVAVKMLEYANDKVGLFIVSWFMRTVVKGNTVHVFEAQDPRLT